MKLSSTDLNELADIAISAATAAGKMVGESRPKNVDHKAQGSSLASQVVTEIDLRAEAMILELLNPTLERFELGLLSEETADDGGRLSADYFWCIDPIDGTLRFIEDQPGYAVSIALVGRDGTPWICAVYDPVEARLFHAVKGVGAFLDGVPFPAEPQAGAGVLLVFGARALLEDPEYSNVVEALGNIAKDMGFAGLELQPSMGAVMNACGVLTNAPACYFRFPSPPGGASLWDYAATACLFDAAGAVATDMFGDPLDLNRADSTYMNHRGVLYATDEQLAKKIRELGQQN